MKKSIRFLVLLGFCISLFSACQKEEVHPKSTDAIVTDAADLMQSKSNKLNLTLAYESDAEDANPLL